MAIGNGDEHSKQEGCYVPIVLEEAVQGEIMTLPGLIVGIIVFCVILWLVRSVIRRIRRVLISASTDM